MAIVTITIGNSNRARSGGSLRFRFVAHGELVSVFH